MARLWTSGAEWNDETAEGVVRSGVGGTLALSSANPRSGGFHYRRTTTTGSLLWTVAITGALATTYYGRAYINLATIQAAGVAGLLSIQDSGATWVVTGRINPDGSVDLSNSGSVVGTSAAGLVSAGAYVMFELAVLIGTGSIDTAELRVNGVSVASGSSLTIGDTVPAFFRFGSAVDTTVDIDDLALNDSTGAAQNSWPGSAKVALLKPISDNAKGTGWVNDANAATNFFDATDNAPPVGIAQTTASTGLHQIQNATSNANSNYDANLTTYTTAGVNATDTVNVVVPMVATGAPVTTSAKAGTIGVVSNPAITNISLGAGGTSGAFWSGTTAGTYPTGWKWSFGTTTYAPSVTVGNSPVARITQVTSSTRIAMVCALGMYVDFTPAAVVTAPIPNVNMAPQRV